MGVLAEHGWSCHAPSLPNHPGSQAVDDEVFRARLTVADYAAEVGRVAEHIGCPCVLVGHSMGGIVVQKYLADRYAAGKEEAGMILVASAPPGALGPLRDEPLPTDAPYALDAETARTRYFRSTDKAVWGDAIARLVPESPSVMNDYSFGAGVEIDPATIRCPGLVVSAGYDGSIVPRDDRLARFYGADYLYAAEIGHDLMLDAGWEQVLAQVEAWLGKTFSGN
jgi:pimeloyl-ACP methyl ester carboxylesterase